MSLRASVRATPALVRAGFLEALAYRAEMLIWILSTTMPLVMLALFYALADEAPFGRFGRDEFVAYYLATLLARQVTSSWAAWEINFEVRQGTLAPRLLRPVHPVWVYATQNLAALPLRLVLALPVGALALYWAAPGRTPHTPGAVAIALATLLGGWLITFFINIAIGSLSFTFDSTTKMLDAYFIVFVVFSGYLMPIELFPAWLRRVADALPFRYQIGLPVEALTGAQAPAALARMVAAQWAYVVALGALALTLWHRGVRRFAAFGG
ncbi:MAG TPA: ABC-2 family transporter protein [Polyangiaceae bacterium]|nr:ABC-2 family transporter protein [Polyangiaceae bacterium]